MSDATPTQIAAGVALWDSIEGCISSEAALAGLCVDLPGSEFSVVLGKACALNVLYHAGVQPANMAALVNHMVGNVLSASPPATRETVVQIASAPLLPYHKVFASKFVYFFLDPQYNVPVIDRWAQRRLRWHKGLNPETPYDTYEEFFDDAEDLYDALPPEARSWQKLDHYLWLAGMYAKWKTTPSGTGIASELLSLFKDSDPSTQNLLADLCPELPT